MTSFSDTNGWATNNLQGMSSRLQAVVVATEPAKGRFSLSTKALEPIPGDMMRDPQVVYDNAERMAEIFRQPLPPPPPP